MDLKVKTVNLNDLTPGERNTVEQATVEMMDFVRRKINTITADDLKQADLDFYGFLVMTVSNIIVHLASHALRFDTTVDFRIKQVDVFLRHISQLTQAAWAQGELLQHDGQTKN